MGILRICITDQVAAIDSVAEVLAAGLLVAGKTGADAKCFKQRVLSAVILVKYRFVQVGIDQSTAANILKAGKAGILGVQIAEVLIDHDTATAVGQREKTMAEMSRY